jgi:hypothetical protein
LPKTDGAEHHRKRDWRLHRRNGHNNAVLSRIQQSAENNREQNAGIETLFLNHSVIEIAGRMQYRATASDLAAQRSPSFGPDSRR